MKLVIGGEDSLAQQYIKYLNEVSEVVAAITPRMPAVPCFWCSSTTFSAEAVESFTSSNDSIIFFSSVYPDREAWTQPWFGVNELERIQPFLLRKPSNF